MKLDVNNRPRVAASASPRGGVVGRGRIWVVIIQDPGLCFWGDVTDE